MRVLIAEDDEALGRIIDRGLRAHGFEVVSVSTVGHALERAADAAIKLLVLDLASGDDLVNEVRRIRPKLPILRLTTRAEVAASPPVPASATAPGRATTTARAAEEDVLATTPATADGLGPTAASTRIDFAEPTLQPDTAEVAKDTVQILKKPFALEELIARIRAMTRGPNERRVTTLIAGDLRLDLLARCAWRGERVIDLPDREFALLEYFVRHPARVLSRREILTDVWGYHFDSASNVVDVYVRYLRYKLDRPGDPSLIASVRGAGYRFDPPSAESRTDLATANA